MVLIFGNPVYKNWTTSRKSGKQLCLPIGTLQRLGGQIKQPRIMQMTKAVPVHDPHLSCKFLDHDDKYYEGEAGQCLHLQLHKITI